MVAGWAAFLSESGTLVFTIGEFSKITGLTVKTLRFYHEQGVLVPSHIDEETGYRYYSGAKVESARVITMLRDLDLPLNEIAEILEHAGDDSDLLEFLSRQKGLVEQKIKRLKTINVSLDKILSVEREARRIMSAAQFDVVEKDVGPLQIAGVRMRGRYSDCGQGFARIGKRLGRYICGKGMLLHYDTEYREADADFEACLPVRGGPSADGISVRELPGGHCVTLVHRGPYDQLGPAYAKILAYIHAKNLEIAMPTREVYHKGPGMIFRGNPRNYLTEIQMFVKGSA